MQPVVKNKISFLYYLIYPSVDTEINFTFDGKASNPIRFLGYFDNKTWMLNFDCFGLYFFARKSSFRPSGSSDSLSYQCFSYDIKARNCVIPFQIIWWFCHCSQFLPLQCSSEVLDSDWKAWILLISSLSHLSSFLQSPSCFLPCYYLLLLFPNNC